MNRNKTASNLKLTLSLLTLVGMVVAGYKFLDVEALGKAWSKFTWSSISWLGLFSICYLLFKSLRFSVLMKPVTDAQRSKVMLAYAASQAASLLPGGVAMRTAMMHRIGISVEKSMAPILANSGSDQFCLLLTGLLLCYYYPALQTSALVLTLLLVFFIVVLSVESSREKFLKILELISKRFGAHNRLQEFYDNLGQLANALVWVKVAFLTLLANATSVLSLCMVVHSFGFEADPWALTAAFVIPGLLGRLSPLPAGAGVTEAGMIGFMAEQSSMTFDQAAVVTLIFRFVDVVLPSLYGAFCQLALSHENLAVSPSSAG